MAFFMSDFTNTLLKIEASAHGGAFGNNSIPEPTEAQCLAGNYKVGRVNLYGLPIAIEQPRGSYRNGIDQKTGKRWTSRVAAHYGYINGTKAAGMAWKASCQCQSLNSNGGSKTAK